MSSIIRKENKLQLKNINSIYFLELIEANPHIKIEYFLCDETDLTYNHISSLIQNNKYTTIENIESIQKMDHLKKLKIAFPYHLYGNILDLRISRRIKTICLLEYYGPIEESSNSFCISNFPDLEQLTISFFTKAFLGRFFKNITPELKKLFILRVE